MKCKILLSIFILFLFAVTFLNAESFEDKVKNLSGKFSGEWTAFMKDDSGGIVESVSWKDNIETSKPVISDQLIYVVVKSKLIFDNPEIPPYEMKFNEGFYIDGKKILKHFFTYGGKEIEETEFGDNTYVFSQKVEAYEFPQLGFLTPVHGNHITVKVIVKSEDQEIHKIKRITTIVWKDEKEKLQSTQFVSLTGYHKRVK